MLAEVAWFVWWVLDNVFGRSLIGQIISVGGGLSAGGAVYLWFVLWLGIPEARQVVDLFARRLRRAKR
jgi:putative peptidoglycan lipid II flippase